MALEVEYMARKPRNRPTDAELAILDVVWQLGPCTVRAVHEQVAQDEDIGYTTVLKTMQIMTEKGLLLRDESNRAHVYRTKKSEEQTQRHLLADLVTRAYRGSAAKLVMQALSSQSATPEEIAEIRRLLTEMTEEE